MPDLSFLPLVNATLNGLALILLIAGYVFIRRKQELAHRRCMMGAFGMSGVFLVSYVTHYVWRAMEKGGVHTKYHGEGIIKLAYYLMLISHILLAMAVPVLAIWMISLGLRDKRELHRRVGRITWPIWVYVSVTGVLIYLMLYPFNPQP